MIVLWQHDIIPMCFVVKANILLKKLNFCKSNVKTQSPKFCQLKGSLAWYLFKMMLRHLFLDGQPSKFNTMPWIWRPDPPKCLPHHKFGGLILQKLIHTTISPILET